MYLLTWSAWSASSFFISSKPSVLIELTEGRTVTLTITRIPFATSSLDIVTSEKSLRYQSRLIASLALSLDRMLPTIRPH